MGFDSDALDWAIQALTIILVAVRFYVNFVYPEGASFRHRRCWAAGDALVGAALFFNVVGAIIGTVLIRKYNFPAGSGWTDKEWDEILEIQYAYAILYWLPSVFVKLAMLLFYTQLVPVFMTKIWWAIKITVVCVVIGGLNSVGVWISLCRKDRNPFSRCMATEEPVHKIVVMAVNLTTDVMVYSIPFFILKTLSNHASLPRRQKVGIGLMFGLGGLSILCTSLVTWTMFLPDDSDFVFINMVCCRIEQYTVIWLSCVPSFKKLALTRQKRKNSSTSNLVATATIGGRSGSKSFSTSGGEKGEELEIRAIPPHQAREVVAREVVLV